MAVRPAGVGRRGRDTDAEPSGPAGGIASGNAMQRRRRPAVIRQQRTVGQQRALRSNGRVNNRIPLYDTYGTSSGTSWPRIRQHVERIGAPSRRVIDSVSGARVRPR
jgi:hypothetical protein